VVVGITVNGAGAQRVAPCFHLFPIKAKKILDQRATFRFRDVMQLAVDPARARCVPFQLAKQRGVRECLKSPVHLAKKPSQVFEQSGSVGVGLFERAARQVGQHPHQPLLFRSVSNFREGGSLPGPLHSRQWQMRRVDRQMFQCGALHVNEASVTRRVHALQNELRTIAALQAEIGVVLAWQSARGGRDTIQIASQALGFDGSEGNRGAFFEEHAQESYRQGLTAFNKALGRKKSAPREDAQRPSELVPGGTR